MKFLIFSIIPFLIFSSIDEKIKNMSLDEKIGQFFISHIYGEKLNADAKKYIKKTKIGNFIYFNWANTLKNKKQIKQLSSELKSFCFENLRIKPIIAIDQEGGRVSRLKEKFSKTTSNDELSKKDKKYSYQQGEKIGYDLNSCGINMNLAPVVDLKGGFISDRSFSKDPKIVCEYSKELIKGFKKYNILSCIKHFPGYGSAEKNPHFKGVISNKYLKDLEKEDLIPFIKLKSIADSIMVSHILFPKIDKNIASKSLFFMKKLLREKYNFEGVIIIDSVVMKSISKNQENEENAYNSILESCITSFKNGADMIIISSLEWSDIKMSEKEEYFFIERIIKGFKKACIGKIISEKKIKESLKRILLLKEKIKILKTTLDILAFFALKKSLQKSADS